MSSVLEPVPGSLKLKNRLAASTKAAPSADVTSDLSVTIVLWISLLTMEEAIASTTRQPVPTRVPILVQENGKTRVYLPEDTANDWEVPAHMAPSTPPESP